MAEWLINDQNFNLILGKTQKEQEELKAEIDKNSKLLSDKKQLVHDIEKWKTIIQEYADISELDAIILNRLIKKIIVHEKIDDDKTRHISIEIHFNLKPIPEIERVENWPALSVIILYYSINYFLTYAAFAVMYNCSN